LVYFLGLEYSSSEVATRRRDKGKKHSSTLEEFQARGNFESKKTDQRLNLRKGVGLAVTAILISLFA